MTTPGAAKDPFDREFRTRLGIAIAVLSACAFMGVGLGAVSGNLEPRIAVAIAIATLGGLVVAYRLGG